MVVGGIVQFHSPRTARLQSGMVRIRTDVVRMSEGKHRSTTILGAVTHDEAPKAASESYIRED